MTPADAEAVLAIARALPAWFNARGLEQLERDLRFQRGVVADRDGTIVGFGTLYVHEAVGHIGWLGVREDLHRCGIGRRLVEDLAAILRAGDVDEMRVDTLGDGVDYEPYERTRAFYRGIGFEDLERIEQDDPGYPERLVMRMLL